MYYSGGIIWLDETFWNRFTWLDKYCSYLDACFDTCLGALFLGCTNISCIHFLIYFEKCKYK